MKYIIQLLKADNQVCLQYEVKESEIDEKKNKVINYKKCGHWPDVVKINIFKQTLQEEIKLS